MQGLTQQMAGQGRKLPVCPVMRIPSKNVPGPEDHQTPVQRKSPHAISKPSTPCYTIWNCHYNRDARLFSTEAGKMYKLSNHMHRRFTALCAFGKHAHAHTCTHTCTHTHNTHMHTHTHTQWQANRYLGLNEGLDLKQLVCSLFDDAQVLKNGGLCDTSVAS